MQNLIFNILIGECPRCGERMEFTAGRCARTYFNPEPTNLQELETKLTDWLTKNKDEIKSVLAQQRDTNSRTRNLLWHNYGPELEEESNSDKHMVIKFCSQLCDMIPVLGLIHINNEGNSSFNHLFHILEHLFFN